MTIEKAKIVLDSLTTWVGQERLITDEIVEAIKTLSQSSLPSNLDEAAKEALPYPMGSLTSEELLTPEPGYSFYQMVKMFKTGAKWMAGKGITVECGVRVYPTLDGKPRPWVALYRNGIQSDSLLHIPQLESIGFEDDDTAIVQIRKK